MPVKNPEIRVILIEPKGEENFGYVARAMSNFGVEELFVVNPKAKITSLSFQRAAHGIPVLENTKIVKTLKQACRDCNFIAGTTGKLASGYNLNRTAVTPKEFVKNAKDIRGKIGIMFGREDIGLKNEEIEKCDMVISIPASEKNRILNISHASAIIFYELFQTRARPIREPPSTRELAALFDIFKGVLQKFHYTTARKKVMQRTFRNLVNRAMISRREYFTLCGVFKTLEKAKKNLNKRK